MTTLARLAQLLAVPSSTQLQEQELPALEQRKVRKAFLKRLYHQQLWCLGQDVRHPGGNLLMRFGFARRRPLRPQGGSTHYQLDLEEGVHVSLWGFGGFFGARGMGGVFVGRYDPAPRCSSAWSLPAPVHRAAALARWPRPIETAAREQASWLRAGYFRFLAQYEAWVHDHAGANWRRRCIAGWSGARIEASLMKRAWSALAQATGAPVHMRLKGSARASETTARARS